MEKQIVTDPLVFPDEKILETALGKNYAVYQAFVVKTGELGITPEWHYYNDGKSWLCKVLFKKKNLAWLSVWNTGFKLTFYFMDRVLEGFYSLDINEKIKKAAMEMKPVGRSHPVTILMANKTLIKDAIKILEYKKSIK